MSELDSMFLRFGGSSWRSKIDPKRPQEKINNNFEEHGTRKGEKKDKKRQYKFLKCFDRV